MPCSEAAAQAAPGRLRAALLGTTRLSLTSQLRLLPSDVLSTGFAGVSLIRHPVLPHSCSLTPGAAPIQAPLYVVIKPCAGRLLCALLAALPHNWFVLRGGFVQEIPQLGIGPGSFSALKPQPLARTGMHLSITRAFPETKSSPPAAGCCEEALKAESITTKLYLCA